MSPTSSHTATATKTPPSLLDISFVKNGSVPHSASVQTRLDDVAETIALQSIDDTLADLVSLGTAAQKDAIAAALGPTGDNKNMHKVPGCTAAVYITVALKPGASSTGGPTPVVTGTADALLSAGLVSLVSQLVTDAPIDEVLALNPDEVTSQLGLNVLLSRGRNDGVASIVRTVQSALRVLLEGKESTDGSGDFVPPVEVAASKEEAGSNKKVKEEVALLLSGGVDSSVALRLLLEQGHAVRAFYLKIWLEDEIADGLGGSCPWEEDFEVCKRVCEQAGVPLEALSLQSEYKDRVLAYTIEESKLGRTPNPDVMCNSQVKFGCFYDAIKDRGFNYIATGHYARTEIVDGLVSLKRGVDTVKDQSYFLAKLGQEQLKRALFPIGHLTKSEVRKLANKYSLPNSDRPDSQGLCFLGKVKFDSFIQSYLGTSPGPVIDAKNGDLIGQHKGLWFHTVGQRKGVGEVVDAKKGNMGPWYVVEKRVGDNALILSNDHDAESNDARRRTMELRDVTWLDGIKSRARAGRYIVKTRHGPELAGGELLMERGASEGRVVLDGRDRVGLAPGQFVVFYDAAEACLGSGVIK
jgi:tRNA-specific 2-thiouridylase